MAEMETTLTTVCVVADLHINSTVAVCPPLVNLDDGGTYHASRGQRWLWECWLDYISQVKARPGRKVVVFGGDMAELDCKRRSVQLISQNKATILQIVSETIAPLVDLADTIIVIRGTPAHEGKGCWLEEEVASDFDNVLPCSKSIKSWYHFRGQVDGRRYDIAHHASMAGKDQTSYKSPIDLAEKALWYYRVMLEQPAPDFVIRSHNHRHREAQIHGCHAIFAPCWSLATEYVYRAGMEYSLADIGGLIIEGDKLECVRYEPREARRVWQIKI
jgi:hypothetical protein